MKNGVCSCAVLLAASLSSTCLCSSGVRAEAPQTEHSGEQKTSERAPAEKSELHQGQPGHHVHKEGFHHAFKDAREWSKKFDDPARDKWQKPEQVIKVLGIGSKDKIADIGAGTGYFSLRIAAEYPQSTVYAADVEPDMIEFMKKKAESKSLQNHQSLLIPTDKPKLPAKVNMVLIVDTYHHLGDRVQYLKSLKDYLEKDGRVVVIDFNAESPEGPPREYRLSKEDVQNEMKSAGLSLAKDIKLLPYQYILVFKAAAK